MLQKKQKKKNQQQNNGVPDWSGGFKIMKNILQVEELNSLSSIPSV